jgi:hypothetical protein
LTYFYSIQAGLYTAATRLLSKAIEIETGLKEQPRPEVLGNLRQIEGEINHFVGF